MRCTSMGLTPRLVAIRAAIPGPGTASDPVQMEIKFIQVNMYRSRGRGVQVPGQTSWLRLGETAAATVRYRGVEAMCS
jgi:hypothetical protein